MGYVYDYDEPGLISDFDRECGTFNLGQFQLPHPQCQEKFVCMEAESDKDLVDPKMRQFAQCIDAMNCHMMVAMSTKVSSGTELALFLHQMIPHHQVNFLGVLWVQSRSQSSYSSCLLNLLCIVLSQNAVSFGPWLYCNKQD